MAKSQDNKDILAVVKAKRRTITKPLTMMLVVAGVVILGYKLWENPQILHQAKEMFIADKSQEEAYKLQLNNITKQMDELKKELSDVRAKAENPDFSAMQQRIDNIEHISVNTIKSKADVDTVLGLIVRMDNVEGRVADLAKVTNKTALILTATMLVKDAAERGGNFVYEAEVLSELAAGNYKIDKEIAIINKVAPNGINSKEELQHKFADIFASKFAKLDKDSIVAENWKDRIYQQVNKVVKIKKADEEDKKVEFSETDRAWAVINDMVARGEIEQAVAIARKPLNAELLANEDFVEWLNMAESYKDFYASINRITANSLAVMKVEFLKSAK